MNLQNLKHSVLLCSTSGVTADKKKKKKNVFTALLPSRNYYETSSRIAFHEPLFNLGVLCQCLHGDVLMWFVQFHFYNPFQWQNACQRSVLQAGLTVGNLEWMWNCHSVTYILIKLLFIAVISIYCSNWDTAINYLKREELGKIRSLIEWPSPARCLLSDCFVVPCTNKHVKNMYTTKCRMCSIL